MDDLDLIADLNAQDDDGLGWSTLADATAPEAYGALRSLRPVHRPDAAPGPPR